MNGGGFLSLPDMVRRQMLNEVLRRSRGSWSMFGGPTFDTPEFSPPAAGTRPYDAPLPTYEAPDAAYQRVMNEPEAPRAPMTDWTAAGFIPNPKHGKVFNTIKYLMDDLAGNLDRNRGSMAEQAEAERARMVDKRTRASDAADAAYRNAMLYLQGKENEAGEAAKAAMERRYEREAAETKRHNIETEGIDRTRAEADRTRAQADKTFSPESNERARQLEYLFGEVKAGRLPPSVLYGVNAPDLSITPDPFKVQDRLYSIDKELATIDSQLGAIEESKKGVWFRDVDLYNPEGKITGQVQTHRQADQYLSSLRARRENLLAEREKWAGLQNRAGSPQNWPPGSVGAGAAGPPPATGGGPAGTAGPPRSSAAPGAAAPSGVEGSPAYERAKDAYRRVRAMYPNLTPEQAYAVAATMAGEMRASP